MDSQFEHAVHFRLGSFGEELLELRKRIVALEASGHSRLSGPRFDGATVELGSAEHDARLWEESAKTARYERDKFFAERNEALRQADELADFAARLVRMAREVLEHDDPADAAAMAEMLTSIPDAVAERLKEMRRRNLKERRQSE